MKPAEFRNLSTDELEIKARDIRKQLYELRVQNKVGKLEKSSRIRLAKRDLARVLTIRGERSEQAAPAVAAKAAKPATPAKETKVRG